MSNFPTNLIPQFPIDESSTFATLSTDIKYGTNQYRRKWAAGVKKRAFALNFSSLTKKEMLLLSSFFNTCNGSLTSFTWTHPTTSTSYTVKFAQPSIQFTEVGEDAFDCDTTLVEVL